MKLIEAKKLCVGSPGELAHISCLLALGGVFSVMPMPSVSSENTFDRIQAGSWVVASMYWEDKLVSTGKAFNPIGWHAAHKTLPIGTLIRVSESEEPPFNQCDHQRSRSVRCEPRSGFESRCRHIVGAARTGHRLYGSSVDSADQACAGRSWKACSRSTTPTPAARASAPAKAGLPAWREFQGSSWRVRCAACSQMAANSGNLQSSLPLT